MVTTDLILAAILSVTLQILGVSGLATYAYPAYHTDVAKHPTLQGWLDIAFLLLLVLVGIAIQITIFGCVVSPNGC